MIFVVAPYMPHGHQALSALGAARKLEAVIQVLHESDPDIRLINTACVEGNERELTFRPKDVGGVPLTECCLPTRGSSRAGKFWNLFSISRTLDVIFQRIGKAPELVWIYNGYSLEILFARALRKRHACKMVLELEDWHFARSRRLNPKPLVDWLVWQLFARDFDHAYYCNPQMHEKLMGMAQSCSVLPGLIPAELTQAPVVGLDELAATPLCVGYFGGLSEEKGCGLLLELIRQRLPGVRFIVTGNGELFEAFRSLARERPEALDFRWNLTPDQLFARYRECQLMINPHKITPAFLEGIFPSKVIEALGSGRFVITTPLNLSQMETLGPALLYAEPNLESLRETLMKAREHFVRHHEQAVEAIHTTRERFGSTAISAVLARLRNDVAGSRHS